MNTKVEKKIGPAVSFFGCLGITIPSGRADLFEILRTEQFAEQVGRLRAAIAQGDKETADFIKHSLPCFTPSGLFHKRNASGLRSFSGFIGVDIDAKDNPQLIDGIEQIRHEIGQKIPYVVYSGLSCSGRGLFVLCRIAEDLERWPDYFNFIAEDLSHYGLKPDFACRDICRLRFVSYDPQAYTNNEAQTLKLPLTRAELGEIRAIITRSDELRMSKANKTASEQTETAQISKIGPKVGERTTEGGKAKKRPKNARFDMAERLGHVVRVLEGRNIDLTDKYEDWFAIGCSIASELGEYGRDPFHRVSSISAKYNRIECDKQFSNILKMKRLKFSISTFVRYCKVAGVEDDILKIL